MLSLVIPTYNESANITLLIEKVEAVLRKQKHEIIVVDDNSPDGTAEIVKRIKNVRLIQRNERGLSSAVISGFNSAKGDILGVMDADLSHDETILPVMLEKIKEYDLVVGSRRVEGGGAEGWTFERKIFSSFANYLAKLILGVKIKDSMSGYFLLKKGVFESCKDRLDANKNSYKILLDIYYKAKPSFIEVPYIFKNRTQGHSKLNYKIISNYLFSIIRMKFNR